MLHMAIQLWQMQACAELVQRHERGSRAKYGAVARLRPDGFFWQQLPLARPRPRVMEWPFGQDMYFFGERETGLRMLSVLGDVVEPRLAAREAVPASPCCFIWQLWDHALDSASQSHSADGRVSTRANLQVTGAGAVFVAKLSGSPACGWWAPKLESPDPEDAPKGPDGMWLLPALPVGMMAAAEAAGRQCLGVRYDRSRESGECKLSTEGKRAWAMGDPGVNKVLHVQLQGKA